MDLERKIPHVSGRSNQRQADPHRGLDPAVLLDAPSSSAAPDPPPAPAHRAAPKAPPLGVGAHPTNQHVKAASAPRHRGPHANPERLRHGFGVARRRQRQPRLVQKCSGTARSTPPPIYMDRATRKNGTGQTHVALTVPAGGRCVRNERNRRWKGEGAAGVASRVPASEERLIAWFWKMWRGI